MYYKYNDRKLIFEKASIRKPIARVVVTVLLSVMLLSSVNIPNSEIDNQTQEAAVLVINGKKPFSEEALVEQIEKLNFRFPEIVLAQATQETNTFTSNLFRENNNLFGMREAKVRANLAAGTNRSHAYYDNWEDSVIDYALYYSTYLHKLKTEQAYYAYLREHYAEDVNYVTRLKQIVQSKNLTSKFKK